MLTLLFLLSQSDPLLVHGATMRPGGPGVSFFSADGTEILQSQGASIARLSATKLERCETLGSANCPACDYDCIQPAERLPVEASMLSLLESDATPLGADAMFVAGGDQGLLVFQRTGPGGDDFTLLLNETSTPASALTSRWCTDVALSDDGTTLVATFGAQDDNELRVYALGASSVTHLRTLDLDPGTIVPGEHLSVAFAVALYGTNAYVAMGDAGVVEIDTTQVGTPNVQQPAAFSSWNVMRDVAIAGDYLFVAADGHGLLEVDLTQPFGSTSLTRVPFTASSCASPANAKNYGMRVDALLEETVEGEVIVVALGTSAVPVRSAEWGPYRPYGNFTWNLGNWTNLDPGSGDTGCSDYLFLFERVPGQFIGQVLDVDGAEDQVVLDAGPAVWESLDLERNANGRLWVISQDLDVASFVRSGSALQLDTRETSGIYARHVSLAQGVLGLRPSSEDYVFFGEDGGSQSGIQELVALPAPAFVDHPDGTLVFPLALDTQWIESSTNLEWVVGGLGLFHRFDSSAPASTIVKGKLRTPTDPIVNHLFVAPYAFTALDPRPSSDLYVQGASRVSCGAAIYSLGEITSGPLPNPDIAVDPYAFLRTHPEISASSSTTERQSALTCQLEVGTLRKTSGVLRQMLVAAAGSNASTTALEHQWPMLAFFDVEGCSQPGQSLDFGPDSVQVLPTGETVVTGRRAYGRTRPGMFFAVTMATLPGLANTTYAFAANTAGAIEAFELSRMYATPTSTANFASRYILPLNVFDGHRDVPVDLVFVPSSGTGNVLGKLYIAASRLGLVSLEVQNAGGKLKLDVLTVVNTPGQASGVAVATDSGGHQRLIVGDHEDYGLRAYGDI